MSKQELWKFLETIEGAQEFVREISAQFPVNKIMAANKSGNVVIYERAKQ